MEKTLYVSKLVTVLDLEWQPRRYPVSNRPAHALSVRLKGNSDFLCGEDSFSGKTGDIIFFPKQFDYVQVAHEAERLIVLNFELADDADLRPIVFHPADSRPFVNDFFDMLQIWTEKKPGYEYAVLAILNRVLEAMATQNTRKTPVERALSYLNRNFSSPEISVGTLAEDMGFSETYLRKLFQKEVGVSPHRYLAGLRLKHAEHLLASGYYTVEETARRCGFQNAKNFSTFIRRETGKTPSALRLPRADFPG